MKRTFMTALIFLAFFSVALAQVDYGTEVQPILNSKCGQCHGGSSGVTVTSYSATMASVGALYGTLIVMPGDTGASPLWNKINPNPQYGNRMPAGGTMSQDNIDIIGQWIVEGALETPSAVNANPAQPNDFGLISSYPNPFNPSTTVRIALSAASPVTLTVYDLKGHPVHEHTTYLGSGSHDIPLTLSHLASGMYVIHMQSISGNQVLISNALKVMMMK
ncbi:T9SS type A sorting domain-containing protein [candidate division KSB1 bacterium]|nr:T9SS type A sorting domain-containing protein [candidate division KSB1 bacterium]